MSNGDTVASSNRVSQFTFTDQGNSAIKHTRLVVGLGRKADILLLFMSVFGLSQYQSPKISFFVPQTRQHTMGLRSVEETENHTEISGRRHVQAVLPLARRSDVHYIGR
jgi:hypothetical protein